MERVNFLPERIRTRRARRKSLLRQGYLFVVVLAAMGMLSYVLQGDIREARAEARRLEVRSTDLARQLAQRATLEAERCDLLIKKRIDDRLGSRVSALAVLAGLSRLVPETIALMELSLDNMTVTVPVGAARAPAGPGATAAQTVRDQQKTITRVRLVVTGIAPTDVDVASFIGQISAADLFEDVNIGYVKTVPFRGRTARQFQASCYVAK